MSGAKDEGTLGSTHQHPSLNGRNDNHEQPNEDPERELPVDLPSSRSEQRQGLEEDEEVERERLGEEEWEDDPAGSGGAGVKLVSAPAFIYCMPQTRKGGRTGRRSSS